MDYGPESVAKTPQSSKHYMTISLKLCSVQHLHILVLEFLKLQSYSFLNMAFYISVLVLPLNTMHFANIYLQT